MENFELCRKYSLFVIGHFMLYMCLLLFNLLHIHTLYCQTYSQCQQLLDTECIAGELFRPDVLDPEMSRANSTVLWELSLQQVCMFD